MTKNKKLIIGMLLAFVLVLASCTPSEPVDNNKVESLQTQLSDKEEVIDELNVKIQDLEMQIKEIEDEEDSTPLSIGPVPGDSLMTVALDVIELIEAENFSDLNVYVHPNMGVRFSPYSYINIQNDQVFQASQFQNLSGNPNLYLWGEYDGSGDPINLVFDDYYDEFIYDEDYANPHMYGNNYPIGTGNMINNFSQVYPNDQFVEFHFTGFDPQYQGMDWSSLVLAFEQHNNAWHLVGIIHGQWTI
ncbi:MAG: hypothetical protein RBR71_08480 [Gudongella sp.]|nr:hypothetical protein [Gudongella sp.]